MADPNIITIKSVSGIVNTSGDNLAIAGVANKRLRVFAIRLSTISATAVIVELQPDDATTNLWSAILQATTGQSATVGDAVQPDAYLFSTEPGVGLDLNLNVGQSVRYALSYWEAD